MRRILAVGVVCLALSGCYTTRISTRAPTSSAVDGRTSVSLFWGITSNEGIAEECPAGLAWSETYHPWWSSLISGITLGIVTPIRTQWACVPVTTAYRQ